jgi:hypothetical protein
MAQLVQRTLRAIGEMPLDQTLAQLHPLADDLSLAHTPGLQGIRGCPRD